ncbi:MAG: hypothetical protein H0T97_10710 [Actinobacteria bacterium]|nr:hypothetical protein [Actinomycetota bacterium]
MSDEHGTERGSVDEDQGVTGMKGTEPDEQVVGDDESGYGGAGQSDAEDAGHVDPGSGENRPPSEQDEDQGI